MISEKPPVNGGVGPPLRPRTFRRNCGDQVFITSPSIVYIDTSVKCPYYSQNDEDIGRVPKNKSSKKENLQDTVKLIDILEEKGWLNIRTVLKDREFEIQDVVAFIELYSVNHTESGCESGACRVGSTADIIPRICTDGNKSREGASARPSPAREHTIRPAVYPTRRTPDSHSLFVCFTHKSQCPERPLYPSP
ncbi:uncharacterized protein LOC113237272 [Hyposmocoma kahamanoa]|uniref:uncharacterized protein LOC113237272 n=1 Tax=Hyposmocoma kahamanoa TaxID=1477025 RepID=UPI000E6DA4A1|nr:uncharacterized protein LOC113237272 [Hyposmocoma kahamanoa]